MEKSIGKGADSPEVKKKWPSTVCIYCVPLLLQFTITSPVQSYQNALFSCMNQCFGMYSSCCDGWVLQWKHWWDLVGKCESGQGQSKWEREMKWPWPSCIWTCKARAFPYCLAMLLVGILNTIITKHSVVLFVFGLWGGALTFVPVASRAERTHPNSSCGNTQNCPSGKTSLIQDAGAFLDLLIPCWGSAVPKAQALPVLGSCEWVEME